MRRKGGISSSDLKKFVESSYKKKKQADVEGYTLDRELSTKRAKVYKDKKTGKAVITHAGTDSASDWLNNLALFTPFYQQTSRYKEAEKAQDKALAKYGKENLTTVSHSQSGAIANILAKKGKSGKSVSLNPALLNPFAKHEGVQVVRSEGDLVSALTPKQKKDVTLKAKTRNPLTEHSADILEGHDREFGGKKYITPHNSGNYKMLSIH